MQKLLFYKITQELEQLLDSSLRKYEGRYKVNLAATTNHGFERIEERQISEKQQNILRQRALKRIAFHKKQISEIRVLKIENRLFPVSIVVDDVVVGVHPKNLPEIACNRGFGTREGETFGIVKTVLSRPNINCGRKMVDDWQVIA
jgi:virulence-associated protein VapD